MSNLFNPTSRGREAPVLPMPPDDAPVREHNNENLFSLARSVNDRGDRPDFAYGGHGQVDNMNCCFGRISAGAIAMTAIPGSPAPQRVAYAATARQGVCRYRQPARRTRRHGVTEPPTARTR